MERLSEELKEICSEFYMSNEERNLVTAAIDRLAHYENLEEQGRLVVLPCAVGAEAWYVLEMFGEICKATISKIELNSFTDPQVWFTVVYHSRCIGDQEIKSRADFMLGKTVFLTRAEAEAALAAASGVQEGVF